MWLFGNVSLEGGRRRQPHVSRPSAHVCCTLTANLASQVQDLSADVGESVFLGVNPDAAHAHFALIAPETAAREMVCTPLCG